MDFVCDKCYFCLKVCDYHFTLQITKLLSQTIKSITATFILRQFRFLDYVFVKTNKQVNTSMYDI